MTLFPLSVGHPGSDRAKLQCEERKRRGFGGRKGVFSEGGYRFHHSGIGKKGYVTLHISKVIFIVYISAEKGVIES